MAAFSSNPEDAFSRIVEARDEQEIVDSKLEDYFEIRNCFAFIDDGSFRRVALQFPDELLKYSFKVVKLINEKCPDIKLYILGDTSYGSCCVDEVAAEHVNADCIIHFGRSCLSLTKRLPVLFIFGKSFIDVKNLCENFLTTFEDRTDKILIFYDVIYKHAADEIEDNLKRLYSSLIVSRLVTEKNSECIECNADSECSRNINATATFAAKTDHSRGCSSRKCSSDQIGTNHQRFGRIFKHPSDTNVEDFNILYIGKESLTLANLMMSYNQNKFFTYDPTRRSIQHETMNINKTLMKRYYLIQKAKEAKTIGIVAGTLGVADYLLIIEHLKNIIRSCGKKYYTFVMGKPNIAKMANFLEIDIFVIVACPENSLIDSKEFYKPIITPFELELACSREKSWAGKYVTDFREVLQEENELPGIEKKDIITDELKSEEPLYSLISGNLIKYLDINEEDKSNVGPSDIILRSQESSLVSFGENSSASFLQTRHWTGLEQKRGQTEVTNAVEGRAGIAAGYTHEMDENKLKRNHSSQE